MKKSSYATPILLRLLILTKSWFGIQIGLLLGRHLFPHQITRRLSWMAGLFGDPNSGLLRGKTGRPTIEADLPAVQILSLSIRLSLTGLAHWMTTVRYYASADPTMYIAYTRAHAGRIAHDLATFGTPCRGDTAHRILSQSGNPCVFVSRAAISSTDVGCLFSSPFVAFSQ